LEPLLLNTGLDRINSTLGASSFSPTIERVVHVDRPESKYLDLTTGNYVAPRQEVGTNWNDLWTQWRAAGADADLMGTIQNGETALGIFNVSSRNVPDRMWDKPWLLDEFLAKLLTDPTSETAPAVLGREDGSATWAFHTLHHGAGLLQIVGYTENPRGVKIRYKLCKMPSAAAGGGSSNHGR
jgi:hypothetical protein